MLISMFVDRKHFIIPWNYRTNSYIGQKEPVSVDDGGYFFAKPFACFFKVKMNIFYDNDLVKNRFSQNKIGISSILKNMCS